MKKSYTGYKSFDYLSDRRALKYKLSKEYERVPSYLVPMTDEQEKRLAAIIKENPVISLHDHFKILTENVGEIKDYYKTGRICTGFEGIAHSPLDAVFGNQSLHGANWFDTIHELGMRGCDAMHSGILVRASTPDDIFKAKQNDQIAWFPMIEHASMIGDELDRLDVLFGLGVRMLGLVFSESNAIGGGLSDKYDGGLTFFGEKVVRRMNDIGFPIDLSHAGDQTTMEAIQLSRQPVFIGHAGSRAVWHTKRMKPDDVIKACADKGGVFGIECAPHTTMSHSHPQHDLESVMEHFEYVVDLVGIDFVTFGPDTMFGDHVGLHKQTADSYCDDSADETFELSDYVKGCENPAEVWWNIPRWMIVHGYSDEEIAKVIGGNVLRVIKTILK